MTWHYLLFCSSSGLGVVSSDAAELFFCRFAGRFPPGIQLTIASSFHATVSGISACWLSRSLAELRFPLLISATCNIPSFSYWVSSMACSGASLNCECNRLESFFVTPPAAWCSRCPVPLNRRRIRPSTNQLRNVCTTF